MATTTKSAPEAAEPTENELTIMRAQIRELQHIVGLMHDGKTDVSPPRLIADGIRLLST